MKSPIALPGATGEHVMPVAGARLVTWPFRFRSGQRHPHGCADIEPRRRPAAGSHADAKMATNIAERLAGRLGIHILGHAGQQYAEQIGRHRLAAAGVIAHNAPSPGTGGSFQLSVIASAMATKRWIGVGQAGGHPLASLTLDRQDRANRACPESVHSINGER